MGRNKKIGFFLFGDFKLGGGFNQQVKDLIDLIPHLDNIDFKVLKTNHNAIADIDKNMQMTVNRFIWFIIPKLEIIPFLGKLTIQFFFYLYFFKVLDLSKIYFLAAPYNAIFFTKNRYVVTIWDLCHREDFMKSDISLYEQKIREKLIEVATKNAKFMVTDSDVNLEKLKEVRKDAIIKILPFGSRYPLYVDQSKVMKRSQPTLFYPANFWAHKNHKKLLLAINEVKNHMNIKVILCGQDMGFKKQIKREIHSLEIEENIELYGNISEEELAKNYRNADALIFPSFCGPTNLPIYEAWSFGLPVMANQNHREFLGEAALLFDPEDPRDIADKILQFFKKNQGEELREKGFKRVATFEEKRLQALKEIVEILEK